MTDQLHYVALSALRESPFNPRKTFPQAQLDELADSIRSQGVLQPIVVRPAVDLGTCKVPEYEIVFGHRRARAAEAAGLERVPSIVRAMTDEEAAIAQVHENCQRTDVTALEEAAGFVHLQQAHRMSADAIAAAIGKSRSYVYGRLKLHSAAPSVHAAVTGEGLSPEIALELARLRGHKLQHQALGRLREYGGGWASYRHAKRVIRDLFSCRIGEATFDATVPLAGVAACSVCPKLAANDPDLAELAADVCTDGECYSAKTAAATKAKVEALRAAGQTVIEGEAAKDLVRGHWLPKHTLVDDLPMRRAGENGEEIIVPLQEAVAELRSAGLLIPQAAHIVHPDGSGKIFHAYSRDIADLIEQAWEQHVGGVDQVPAPRSKGHAGMQHGPDTTDWTPAERIAGDREAWVRVRRAALAGLRDRPRTTDDLRLMLIREYDMADSFGLTADVMGLDAELEAAREAWEANDAAPGTWSERAWWVSRLARMFADDLAVLALGVALEDQLGYGGRVDREDAARAVALAERYGVDVVAAALDPADAIAETT